MPQITIPEMQKVKERFPQYKDTEDVALLNTIVRKYPVYKPIAERVGQEIRDTRAEVVKNQQVLPSKTSPLARATRALTRTSGLQQLETSQFIYQNKDKIPTPEPGESPTSYYQRFKKDTGLNQRESEVASAGTLAQLDEPMTLGIASGFLTHPVFTAKMLAAFTGLDLVSEKIGLNKKVSEISNVTTRDVVEVVKFVLEGGLAGGLAKARLRFKQVPARPEVKAEAQKVVTELLTEKDPVTELGKQLKAYEASQQKPSTTSNIETTKSLVKAPIPKVIDVVKDKVELPKVTKSKASLAIQKKLEKANIMPELTPPKSGKAIVVESFGRKAIVPLVEEYKGKKIVMTGENFSVWDPKKKTLFVVALDDSKMSGPRRIIPEANNVEAAREYIDFTLGDKVPPVETFEHPETKKAKRLETIKAVAEARRLKKVVKPSPKDIEINPGLVDEVMQRPEKQAPETLDAAKAIKAEPTPEIVKPTAKSELLKDDEYYSIVYETPTGTKEKFTSGAEAKKLEAGGNKILSYDNFLGEEGKLELQPLHDAIIDVQGFGEKLSFAAKVLFKRFGTPFMIGQKYPAFKPIYAAVQNAHDYKNELFFTIAERVNPKFFRSLPEASQVKVVEALRIGNEPSIQKYFSREELVRGFGFNESEIKGYMGLKRGYDLATSMKLRARQLTSSYEDMSVEERAAFNAETKATIARRGGFVNQQRLQGDWAVYAPPEKGSKLARWFAFYDKKSEAVKVKEALGPDAKVSLRTNIDNEMFKHLSLSDLEALIEASGVSKDSHQIQALRKILLSKTFGSHDLRRRNVPGLTWTPKEVLALAIDYAEGAANHLARITGRVESTRALAKSSKTMSAELKAYAQEFLDGYYNTGAMGWTGFSQFMYANALAFKPSFLAMNLTQRFSTTWPYFSKYYKGLGIEREAAKADILALRYLGYIIKKTPHGLSSETFGYLEKMRRQGVLGDQMTQFELQVRHPIEANYERAMSFFGRMSEVPNRVQAALIARNVATEKLGLTDKDAIYAFGKNGVYATQFAYNKANVPTQITGSGNVRNWLHASYKFRTFTVSYLQLLNSMMPWRGAPPKQTARALVGLVGQAGIKGLPFIGLAGLAYKQMTGHTLDNDMREALEEAGLPEKAIDVTLHGAWSYTGVDASMMLGLGDIAGLNGGVLERVGGYPVTLLNQYLKALFFVQQGEAQRALESGSASVIKNIIRSHRYAKEGLRKHNDKLLLNPSKQDVVLQSLGFTPLSVSKAYLAEETKEAMSEHLKGKAADLNLRIAKALRRGDREEAARLRRRQAELNTELEAYERIFPSSESIEGTMKQGRGIDNRVPKKLRAKFKEIDERFGVE